MNILVYDINLLNIKVYLESLMLNLSKYESINLIVMYDEHDSVGEDFCQSLGIKIIKKPSFDVGNLYLKLENLDIDLLIVNAQRLADSVIVSVARELQIPSVMIQHGMYLDFMPRENSLFFRKILKTVKYLYYASWLGKKYGNGYFSGVKNFIRVFVFGKGYKENIQFTECINTDHVFVYGEYWSTFHSKKFGYRQQQIDVIGCVNREAIAQTQKFDGAIYVAQTLVEDGRMDPAQFKCFLDDLCWFSQNIMPVKIKLHPRSHRELYRSFTDEFFVDSMVRCEVLIGHYSTVLGTFASGASKMLLVELDDHPIPDYYAQIGTCIKDLKELHSANDVPFLNTDGLSDVFSESIGELEITRKIMSLARKEIQK